MSLSTNLPELAHALAAEAHAGQRRRHGAPYIDHPVAVAAIAQDLAHAVGVPFDDVAIATALLHDVIEDSPDHSEAVVADRLGQEVASRVLHLTKTGKGHEATAAYYGQLMGALPTTRLTKIAGFEWGTGFYINSVPPEQAAAYLREIDVEMR